MERNHVLLHFLVTTIVSPWWGRLADRKGRKLMLLRASLGMAIVISLMGAVTSVYQLIGLRLLQGVFPVISVMRLR